MCPTECPPPLPSPRPSLQGNPRELAQPGAIGSREVSGWKGLPGIRKENGIVSLPVCLLEQKVSPPIPLKETPPLTPHLITGQPGSWRKGWGEANMPQQLGAPFFARSHCKQQLCFSPYPDDRGQADPICPQTFHNPIRCGQSPTAPPFSRLLQRATRQMVIFFKKATCDKST